jgi:two-component system cell cycle sensor histidine kinase/response regulator CckA
VESIVSEPERTEPLRHLEKMGAVSRLAGGLSRDVGELIASAAESVRDALGRIPPLDRTHDALSDAAAALQRAVLIARQLEMLARPAPVRPQPRSLGDGVRELLPLVGRLAGRHITLQGDDLDSRAWISAEAGHVEHVLFHLVVNARDAMPHGGSIAVRVARQVLAAPRAHRFGIVSAGEWSTLEVRDDGCGMGDQVLARLFEPFFTTKAPGLGSGLGLATVYGIARQLDGQVMVDSVPGHGSAITLWFPAVAPAEAVRCGDTAAAPAVLLVEDDEWVRALAARALRHAGYGVLEATDAESALELLRDVAGRNIRVVLTDVVMPGMWGDDLARCIAAERQDVRLVLMTGRSPEALPDAALRDLPLLRKPFSRSQLLAAVAG